jgi:DMSO/TMAO reductase YedYZ heme-binding membrane subunit
LLSTIFVLLIPVLLRFKKTSLTVYLSSERRWIGIYTFVFAAIHVFLVYNFFFGWDINRLLNHPNRLYLSMGTIALIIFALMTATSNNYSVKKLGKNWKRLHLLIYPALILILIHSFSIGLVYLKSTWVKVVILLIVAAVLTAKFFKYKKSK